MKQYIVDAFTSKVFAGNPAAVCVLDSWPSEKWMKLVARENSLSETAFIVKEKEGYHLRWFTPVKEVELCGHATLASSFVILNYYDKEAETVEFNTLSGKLTIKRVGNKYQMNLPTYDLKEIEVTDDMEKAFGARPSKAILGLDLVCVFDDEETVINMNPDQQLLAKLPGRLQNATALSKDYDCVSRSFCPTLGIPEDPVCGSAHCQIADYWSKVLNKKEIVAYQASKRTGVLYCQLTEQRRINISGEAVLFAISKIM